MPETRLRISSWHVARQEQMITNQRRLISKLQASGLPTDDAENFLKQMSDDLAFRQQALGGSQPPSERYLPTVS